MELMINAFTNEHLDQIVKIEKTNFEYPWSNKQFYIYSKQLNISLSYVYYQSSKVIGYLMSEIITNEVHLHNIAVEKKYQNNRVGLKLIRHLIKRSQLLNKQKICLEVSSANVPALNLYHYLGFSVVGKRKGYYNNNKDAILMDLIL